MSSKRTKTWTSYSSKETEAIGTALAKEFRRAGFIGRAGRANAVPRGSGAAVFALTGELGAGKTTFVRGFLKGLGLRGRVQSPTFVLMRRHALRRAGRGKRGGRDRGFKNVFHMDAYRLAGAKHLVLLGVADIFADSRNIVLIEWAERARGVLPRNAVRLFFRHGRKEDERRIIMRP